MAQIEPTFCGLHAAHDAVFAFLPLLAIIAVLVAVIFLQHARMDINDAQRVIAATVGFQKQKREKEKVCRSARSCVLSFRITERKLLKLRQCSKSNLIRSLKHR